MFCECILPQRNMISHASGTSQLLKKYRKMDGFDYLFYLGPEGSNDIHTVASGAVLLMISCLV